MTLRGVYCQKCRDVCGFLGNNLKIENLAGVKHLTNFTSGLNSSLLDLKFKILQLCFNFLRILSRTGPTSLQKGIT